MHSASLVSRGVLLVAAEQPALLVPASAVAQAGSSASFVPVTGAVIEDPHSATGLTCRRALHGRGFRSEYPATYCKSALQGFNGHSFPLLQP